MGLFYVRSTPKGNIPRSRLAKKLIVAGGLVCACASALATALPVRADDGAQTGQQASAGAPNVTLEILNANLLAVIELLRQRTGAQFIVTGDAKAFRPVNVNVSAPLPQVLDYVAESAGAEVTRDANGVFTIRPEGTPSPVDSESTSTSSAPNTLAGEGNAQMPQAPLIWEKIVLNYIQPAYIKALLDGVPSENLDPYKYGVAPSELPGTTETTTPPIVMAPNQPNNAAVNPSTQTVVNGATATGSLSNPSGGSLSIPMNVGAGTNTELGAGNQFLPVPGTQANQAPFAQPPGGGVANGQQGQQGSLRPDGLKDVVVVTDQNALLVQGTPLAISQLRELISKLDVPAKQVEIKVEFVTASVGVINQFGASFDLIPNPSIETGFFGTGPQGAGSVFLNYSHGNIVAAMAALLETSKGRVISAPIITATNNTAATIEVVSQIPYEQGTVIAQGNGNALSTNTVSFLSVPSGLSITPRINGDNSVSMDLAPVLSAVGQSPPSGPPPITQQTIHTYRTVGNGETLVLGGLVSKTETDSTQEFPFLGELPIIGNLFRTKDNNVSDNELLVFVTPTILPIPGSTTTGENVAPVEGGFGVTP